jgi:hypothetical protein
LAIIAAEFATSPPQYAYGPKPKAGKSKKDKKGKSKAYDYEDEQDHGPPPEKASYPGHEIHDPYGMRHAGTPHSGQPYDAQNC